MCDTRHQRQARQFLLMILLAATLSMPQVIAAQGAEPTPLPLYALPDARFNRAYSSGSIALSNDGRILVAANMLNGTISVMNVIAPNAAVVQAEIQVGKDPRSVALLPDNVHAVVTNRADGTLMIVDIVAGTVVDTVPLGGALPYAVVTDRNDMAYVSMMGSDEVLVVSLTGDGVIDRIAMDSRPAGLTLWGDFLYVTHFWNGNVSLVYLPQARITARVSSGMDTTALQAIELDITRGIAYLPQSRSNAQNENLTFDSVVFPVVNVLELSSLTLLPQSRVTLDTADRPVNMPFDIALDRFRNWLYVANAGSDDVSVIDLNTGLARANIQVGANPRGVLLNRDNTYLFVHNMLDGTITIIDTNELVSIDVLPISNLTIPVDLLFGMQLFHSAADPRMSEDHWVSCANCHFDGLPDGLTWEGFPDGPRNTPPLFRLVETAPYNWFATWDELADVELKIRGLQAGSGLIDDFLVSDPLGSPHAGASLDMDTLVAYLTSLQAPPNANTFPPEIVERGAEVFEEQNCASCHVGPAGANLQAFDVGTGDGEAFDTPSLRYLWLSAPYFHDGSADTLFEVFTRPGTHQLIQMLSPNDIQALVWYLLNWSS